LRWQFEEVLKDGMNKLSALGIDAGWFRKLVHCPVFIELRAISKIIHPARG
jgi:hypothetical protein